MGIVDSIANFATGSALSVAAWGSDDAVSVRTAFETDLGKRTFYTAAGNESLFQSVAVPTAAAFGFSLLNQGMCLFNPVGLGTLKAPSNAGFVTKTALAVLNHPLAKPYGLIARAPHVIPRAALATILIGGFILDKLYNGVTQFNDFSGAQHAKSWQALHQERDNLLLELAAGPALALISGAIGRVGVRFGIPEWVGSSLGFFALRELQTLFLTHEYDGLSVSDWASKHAWKNLLSAVAFMGIGTAVHQKTDHFFNVGTASHYLTPFQRFFYQGFTSLAGASVMSYGLINAAPALFAQEHLEHLGFGDYVARDLRAGALMGAFRPLLGGRLVREKLPLPEPAAGVTRTALKTAGLVLDVPSEGNLATLHLVEKTLRHEFLIDLKQLARGISQIQRFPDVEKQATFYVAQYRDDPDFLHCALMTPEHIRDHALVEYRRVAAGVNPSDNLTVRFENGKPVLPDETALITTFLSGLNPKFLDAAGGADRLTAILRKTEPAKNDVEARLKALFNKIRYGMDELEWVGGYGSSTTLKPTPFANAAEVKNFASKEIPDFILCAESPTRLLGKVGLFDLINNPEGFFSAASLALSGKWARTQTLFAGTRSSGSMEYAYNRRTPEGTDRIALTRTEDLPVEEGPLYRLLGLGANKLRKKYWQRFGDDPLFMDVQLKTKDGVLAREAWISGKNVPVNDRMCKLDLVDGEAPGHSIIWVNPNKRTAVIADLAAYSTRVRNATTDEALNVGFAREMSGLKFAETYAELSYRHEIVRLITELSPDKIAKLTRTMLGTSGHTLALALNQRIADGLITVRHRDWILGRETDPYSVNHIDPSKFKTPEDANQFIITINRTGRGQVRTALRTRMDMLEVYEHYFWNQVNWYIADSELAWPVERMLHKVAKTPLAPLKWFLHAGSYALTVPFSIAGRYRFNDTLNGRHDLTTLIRQPPKPFSVYGDRFNPEQPT